MTMPRKKKPRFRAATEVRAIARERLGSPPPNKVIPDPRLKPEKYPKKELEKLSD